jgi:hypothetical protein
MVWGDCWGDTLWKWMGSEWVLIHEWTAGIVQDIVAKLLLEAPVDVVMFDQLWP